MKLSLLVGILILTAMPHLALGQDSGFSANIGSTQEDPLKGFFEKDQEVELGYKFKTTAPMSLSVGWVNADRVYGPGADFVDNTIFSDFVFTPMKNTYFELYGEDTPQAHFKADWAGGVTPHYLLGDRADFSVGYKYSSYSAVSYSTLSPGMIYYLPKDFLVGGTAYLTPGPTPITAGRLFVRKSFGSGASIELSGAGGQNLLDQYTIEQFNEGIITLVSPKWNKLNLEFQFDRHWGQILLSNSFYGGIRWTP